MQRVRRNLAAAALAAALCAPLVHAVAQTDSGTQTMSPPPTNLAAEPAKPPAKPAPLAMSPQPGTLGGKQPMSAQASNIDATDTRTGWAPGLPIPPVDDDAPPLSFLDAARKALAANRTGEAQEALERAESRALDRSVKPSTAAVPSGQTLVRKIETARQALASGDRKKAASMIELAMRDPEASAPAK